VEPGSPGIESKSLQADFDAVSTGKPSQMDALQNNAQTSKKEQQGPDFDAGAEFAQRIYEFRWKVYHLVLYSLFCLLFTITMLGNYNSHSLLLEEGMTTILLKKRGGPDYGDFDKIQDIGTFWTWLKGPFLEGVYPNATITGEHQGGNGWQGPGWLYGNNQIIGAIQLTQLRVKLSTDVPSDTFGSDLKYKYPMWSPSDQQKEPFGPNLQYTWSERDGLLDQFPGQYDYPAEGYVHSLDGKGNRTGAMQDLSVLEANQWLGMATRLVIIDVNVYNPNVELFCICRIGVEFLPSGRVKPSHVFLPAVLTRYEKASGILWAAVEFLLYAYILLLTAVLVAEMYSKGLSFFQEPLNWVELINQLMFMLVFGMRIASEVLLAPKYDQLGIAGTANVDLFEVAYIEHTIDSSMAFNAVLMYTRLLRYMTINPSISKIVNIFGLAIRTIMYLLIIVFVLLFAYALAFHLTLRSSLHEFSSIGNSMMTVMRSVLGDFPIIDMEGTNAFLARLLFMSYMVVLFFIVLNMFIAVLSELAHTYSMRPSYEEYLEWCRMKRLLLEMFCCCFGYGKNGSVVDMSTDDDADRAVEAEARQLFVQDQKKTQDLDEEHKDLKDLKADQAEISEAAKLNQRMAAVEFALSSIGDAIIDKQTRRSGRKRAKGKDEESEIELERPQRPASRAKRASQAAEQLESPRGDRHEASPRSSSRRSSRKEASPSRRPSRQEASPSGRSSRQEASPRRASRQEDTSPRSHRHRSSSHGRDTPRRMRRDSESTTAGEVIETKSKPEIQTATAPTTSPSTAAPIVLHSVPSVPATIPEDGSYHSNK